MDEWSCTKEALSRLQSILQCKICSRMVSDPCSLEICDHHFCRGCVEKVLDADHKCPVCNSFAWERDIKSNRQLAHTAALCLQLESVIKTSDDEEGRGLEEKGDYPGNHLDDWEETDGYDKEEVNTYMFPSPDCSIQENEQTFVDVNDQNGKEMPNAWQSNADQGESTSCLDSSPAPVFPTVKTYSRAAIKKACLSRKLGRPITLNVSASTAGPNKLNTCEFPGEITTQSDECRTSLSQIGSMTDRMRKCVTKAARMESKHSNSAQVKGLVECNISDKELLERRAVFKELDVHVNTSRREIQTNCLELEEIEAVPKESELQVETEGLSENCSFTKVRSRNCSDTHDPGNRVLEEDGLHGTPRTRASKRRASKNINATRSDQHGKDQSSAESTCKKSKSHQSTMENFLVKPVSQSEKLVSSVVTSGGSQRGSHMKRNVSQIPVGHRNKQGETPLHVAAIKGNLEAAIDLLKQGADPNAKDYAGWTPLHEACNHGHVAVAELLLDSGAMFDMTGGFDHDTPLHDAVANGRLQIAKLLVERGAPLNVRNKRGILPKDYAVGDEMMDVFNLEPQKHTRTSSTSSVQPLSGSVSTTTHKVILTTGLTAAQKELVQTCVGRLGGSCVVSEFSASATHVVTVTDGNGICKRTVKYLHSVLAGKWVVRFEWISKCLRRKQWADETPFEVVGTSEAEVEAPRRARQNASKQLPSLFDGCNFFFSGDFKPPCVPKDELIQMVKSGGGKILSRVPKPDFDVSRDVGRLTTAPTVVYHARPDSDQYRRTEYVIFDPLSGRRSRVSKYSDAVSSAPVSWLMDCISHFEIVDVPRC